MGQAIFIGYRRADTADVAGRLYDAMSIAFGEGKVFKDVDSIPLGADFAAHIRGILPKCRVFLALIGRDWASAADANGMSRFDDAHDLVRIEIETALATPRLLVVPVLVNGASMPAESEVPASLRPLLQRQAAILRQDPDFRGDIARLADALREHLRTGRLDLRSLGGAARVASNAVGLSGWLVLSWLLIAGVGVTAAVPQLREPVVHAAATLLHRPSPPTQLAPAPNTVTQAPPTSAQTTSSATATALDASVAPPEAPESAPQGLGNGLSVVLVSLSHVQRQYDSYYVATLRFENPTPANVGVAVLGQASRGEMVLTDRMGGSCSMIWNGDTWGTLRVERSSQYGSENFTPLPANGQTQQTIFFSESRCDSPITAATGLSISGSFFLDENTQRRAAAVYFGNLSIYDASASARNKQ